MRFVGWTGGGRCWRPPFKMAHMSALCTLLCGPALAPAHLTPPALCLHPEPTLPGCAWCRGAAAHRPATYLVCAGEESRRRQELENKHRQHRAAGGAAPGSQPQQRQARHSSGALAPQAYQTLTAPSLPPEATPTPGIRRTVFTQAWWASSRCARWRRPRLQARSSDRRQR